MPIYEYECRDCKQRFDKMQSFSDEPIRVCPNCGGETRRVMHPAGVVFKGSGWYSTDNRKAPASSENGSTSASGEGGSSDTAAATKSEPSAAKSDTSSSKSDPSSGTGE